MTCSGTHCGKHEFSRLGAGCVVWSSLFGGLTVCTLETSRLIFETNVLNCAIQFLISYYDVNFSEIIGFLFSFVDVASV